MGGTGVYSPQDQGRVPHQRQQSEPMAQMMAQHPEAVEGRPSMQQGRQRGVLVKNNRKFTDAYAHDQGPNHHGGRSGAVKKVQDFFPSTSWHGRISIKEESDVLVSGRLRAFDRNIPLGQYWSGDRFSCND